MPIYYPALIASAIFFAGIVVQLHDKDNMTALFISLAAIPTILLLGHLSEKNMDLFAYLLILLPIYLLYIGYSMGIKTSATESFSRQPYVPDRLEAENA